MKNRSFWLYLLIIVLLYLIWGNVLAGDETTQTAFNVHTAVSQIVLNFAVFYPPGLLAGMRGLGRNRRSVILAALVFNLYTYVLAFALGWPLDFSLTVLDFVSMFFFLWLAAYIGFRTGRRAKDQEES